MTKPSPKAPHPSSDQPSHQADITAPDGDRKVCFCHSVCLSRLLKAIREGADTIEKIQAETCASTGCGGCEMEVREILAKELRKKAG